MIANYDTAIRVHSAIAPVAVEFIGKTQVQGKATARKRIERTAGAPVERQESPRFTRSRASDLRSLDNDHLDAAASQEVGGASSNHAAAANHNAHLIFCTVG